PSPLAQRRSPRVRSLERGEYAPRHPRDVRYGALGVYACKLRRTVSIQVVADDARAIGPSNEHRPLQGHAQDHRIQLFRVRFSVAVELRIRNLVGSAVPAKIVTDHAELPRQLWITNLLCP